jgi:hypothetical protein
MMERGYMGGINWCLYHTHGVSRHHHYSSGSYRFYAVFFISHGMIDNSLNDTQQPIIKEGVEITLTVMVFLCHVLYTDYLSHHIVYFTHLVSISFSISLRMSHLRNF